MILSIITINLNNAAGLKRAMESVLCQNYIDYEYIVVDGASSDGSVQIIKDLAGFFGNRIKWISEPDKGIYNAMNKGIKMATGDYVEFLNSGDCLKSPDVVGQIIQSLEKNNYPSILYGNIIKEFPDGRHLKDVCFGGEDITFLGFYKGSLNHSTSFIKKNLFVKYGMYDESLRIVSDWKWFLNAIILGDERPVYTNIDVSLFDMTGISETNKELEKAERQKVLSELIPAPILSDYDQCSFAIGQFKRLQRHPWAYRIVWFIERVLFKFEKNK